MLAVRMSLYIPVFVGRWLMDLWMPGAKIHELYTAACGLYICWLSIRAVIIISRWVPLGRQTLMQKFKEWILIVGID